MKRTDISDKTAPCSLMCHTCGAYKDGLIRTTASQLLKYMDGVQEFYEKHHPSQSENHRIFLQVLESYSAVACSGCRNRDHCTCSIEGCFIPECTRDHNVDFCGECTEFPCGKTVTLFEAEVYRQWLSGNQEIRENGIEKFWEKNCEKPHYQAYKKQQDFINGNDM